MELYDWQKRALNEISEENNVILSSPTGSGKTKVFMDWALAKGTKIIITAPIKALSNQRYRELKAAGFKVGIETGDFKNVPEDFEILCCTQEIYTLKYTDLEDVTLIVDELHYIFENQERSRLYLEGLSNSKANSILICSATLGNLAKLQNYIQRLTNRLFYLCVNNERSTELKVQRYTELVKVQNALVIAFSVRNCEQILDYILCYRKHNTFSGHNKKLSRKSKIALRERQEKIDIIKKYAAEYNIKGSILDDVSYGVSIYHGKMLPKEKLFIEKLFEEKIIDTVIGTDALSIGVNFPVERVVFCQMAKYPGEPISKNMFDQIGGRAGRKGYFDVGYVNFSDDLDIEFKGFNTKKEYSKIINRKNEEICILPLPLYSKLLSGETTIAEEVKYIKKYSTEPVDEAALVKEMEDTLEFITTFSTLPNFNEELAKVYFEEYTPEENCEIFLSIFTGATTEELIKFYGIDYYSLLRLRKYIRQLPDVYKYFVKVEELEDYIKKIDSTPFDIENED